MIVRDKCHDLLAHRAVKKAIAAVVKACPAERVFVLSLLFSPLK
ncbi:hypothetical protein PRUB_a3881 [Pseudoalteromonas rubra]|uniref:Uncharacterized protein n=1 Tax=Pseudoalteromonas rubra TaxID=43658 RepID=A0A8T0C8J6_9GAMM|nr:hypothetical protein PRUB_a3881 [Pseudoalteromonas rubra]